MISLLSKLITLLVVIVLFALIFTLPPIVNYFAPLIITPLVEELFPQMGILEPKLSAKSYSFAVPFGLKTKGFNLDFDYQYPDLKKAGFILSGDEFFIRINAIDSFKKRKLVLSFAFEGLLVKSKLLPEKSVTASSYDYQRYIISEGSIEREIDLTPFYEFNSYRNKLKEAILAWNKAPAEIDGELEVSILSKKYSVPIREIREKEIIFDPLLLTDLSLAYRKPFLASEIAFMQKYPLYALNLLSFRLTGEEHAVVLYPLDINALSKASILLYHHQISSYFGPNASLVISRPDDTLINSEYELASSMGRATIKKGITFDNLNSVDLVNKLIKSD